MNALRRILVRLARWSKGARALARFNCRMDRAMKRPEGRAPFRLRTNRVPVVVAAVGLFLAITPGARTQYLGAPQPPALVGPTLGASLRNAAAATHAQAGLVRKGASDWGRRASTSAYSAAQFQQDYATAQFQFQMLREQFNGLGNLALQLGRPRANNAVAELDAGLNIIAELFTFLADQFNAGTLDHKTIVRTCRALEDAMREWERELKKNSSRIGLVW
jgi:hypothetical protein